MTHRLPGGTGRSRAVTVTSRPVLDIDPTAVIAAPVDPAFGPAMCAREALRGALRARRIEDGLSALMKGGGPCPEKVPAAAPSPLPPPNPPFPPSRSSSPLRPPAFPPASTALFVRAQARVAISGMPAAHFTVASSVAAASLAVRGRRTVCAYLLEDLQGRPHRRLVAGEHRVLHGHRGRECGAPLRYHPVGASHSST